MFSDYQYAYVIGAFFIGLPIAGLLFYYRPDVRREMLTAGILLGITGVLSEHWFLRDYWHPEEMNTLRIFLGDFSYGFFLGSIGSVIYETLLRKHFMKRRIRTHHWTYFLLPMVTITLLILDLPVRFFGINSIYSATVSLFVLATIIIYFRKDLFWDSILSGLLFGLITFFGYLMFIALYPGVISAWWELSNISGVLIKGVPLEELIFACGAGMAVGPAYEFFTGLQFQKQKR